jgi:uncharacterized protein YdhG (YjbR/CyaY superfamily)
VRAPPEITTPADYIANLPDDRRAAVEKLDQLIRKAAPKLKPHVSGGMLGYGPYRYKYASGREGESSVIALASQKNHISVYICATDGGEHLPERNKDRLGKVSVGRGCIRFKKIEDLDLEAMRDLVKEAAALPVESLSS